MIAVLAVTGVAVGVALARQGGSPRHDAGAPGASPSSVATTTASPSPFSPSPGESATGPAPGSATPPDTPSSTPATTPSTDTPTGPGTPPAGFVRTEDPEGFILDVPAGWNRRVDKGSVYYEEPTGIGLLQIYPVGAPDQTPYEALQATSQEVAGKGRGFRLLSLSRLGAADDSPAELQYSYQGPSGDDRLIVDRAFMAPNGVQYSLLARATSQEWPLQRTRLDAALGSFCPLGFCS